MPEPIAAITAQTMVREPLTVRPSNPSDPRPFQRILAESIGEHERQLTELNTIKEQLSQQKSTLADAIATVQTVHMEIVAAQTSYKAHNAYKDSMNSLQE
jgi:hypothetical protein